MNAEMCAQALIIILDDFFGHAQANFVRYLITCVWQSPDTTQTLVASAIDSTYMHMHI
jgi:hypothetical protein